MEKAGGNELLKLSLESKGEFSMCWTELVDEKLVSVMQEYMEDMEERSSPVEKCSMFGCSPVLLFVV